MNWKNVNLIFRRETRDQLRDRRTLFMIAVLPILLYPLMGMSFFQIAQFIREQPTRVLVVGDTQFEGTPPLIEPGDEAGNDHRQFSKKLFRDPERSRLLDLQLVSSSKLSERADKDSENKDADKKVPLSPEARDEAAIKVARQAVRDGEYEAVVYFPPDFSARLQAFRERLLNPSNDTGSGPAVTLPNPQLIYNQAKEKSQIAQSRVLDVLRNWDQAMGEKNLTDHKLPASTARPFDVTPEDVAEGPAKKAALWAKILPFVLLLWALTGAFYPAVDLCAGEKERGTLETLLSSPAERSEIVWGKLLTVVVFSLATSILNMVSMGLTGSFVLSQFTDFGLPPLSAMAWLLVALVPVSVLFSALCLALAAFARSTKEGQYYLMPLVLVTMPLTIMPMSPGVELNFGTSLIPISGVVLLLRSVLEGNYAAAIPYAPTVLMVTIGCALLAVRWAADQFNTESVLFRESERLDLGLWLKHVMRDRGETPSVANGVFCGLLILMIGFFMSFALARSENIMLSVVTRQLVVIATPALIMAVMLTRSPRKTLLLKAPLLWSTAPIAMLLALTLNPLSRALGQVVLYLYPVSDEMKAEYDRVFAGFGSNLWVNLLLIAVLPAICEEIAFRGFILSGLRHMGHKWRAIIISALFFAIAHGAFQQSISASILGVVLAYLAIQTGSLLPCVLFHMTHNGLVVLESTITPKWLADHPIFDQIIVYDGNAITFTWPMLIVSAMSSGMLLAWYYQLPYAATAEERLQESIEQNTATMASV